MGSGFGFRTIFMSLFWPALLALVASAVALPANVPPQANIISASDEPPDIDSLNPKYSSVEAGQVYEMHQDVADNFKQTFDTGRYNEETKEARKPPKALPNLQGLTDDPSGYNEVAIKTSFRKGKNEGWSELSALAAEYKEKFAGLQSLAENVTFVESEIKEQQKLVSGFGQMKNALLNMIGKADVVSSSMKHQAEAFKKTQLAQLNLLAANEKDLAAQRAQKDEIEYKYNSMIQEADLKAAQSFATLRERDHIPAFVDYGLATLLTTDETDTQTDLKMKVKTETAMREKLAQIQKATTDYKHDQEEATAIEKARLKTNEQRYQQESDRLKKDAIDGFESNLELARKQFQKATSTKYGHAFLNLVGAVDPMAAAAAAGPQTPEGEVETLDKDTSDIVAKARTELDVEKKQYNAAFKLSADKQQADLTQLKAEKEKIDSLNARLDADLKNVRMFASMGMASKGVTIEHINTHLPSFAESANPSNEASEGAAQHAGKGVDQLVSQMEKVKADFNSMVTKSDKKKEGGAAEEGKAKKSL